MAGERYRCHKGWLQTPSPDNSDVFVPFFLQVRGKDIHWEDKIRSTLRDLMDGGTNVIYHDQGYVTGVLGRWFVNIKANNIFDASAVIRMSECRLVRGDSNKELSIFIQLPFSFYKRADTKVHITKSTTDMATMGAGLNCTPIATASVISSIKIVLYNRTNSFTDSVIESRDFLDTELYVSVGGTIWLRDDGPGQTYIINDIPLSKADLFTEMVSEQGEFKTTTKIPTEFLDRVSRGGPSMVLINNNDPIETEDLIDELPDDTGEIITTAKVPDSLLRRESVSFGSGLGLLGSMGSTDTSSDDTDEESVEDATDESDSIEATEEVSDSNSDSEISEETPEDTEEITDSDDSEVTEESDASDEAVSEEDTEITEETDDTSDTDDSTSEDDSVEENNTEESEETTEDTEEVADSDESVSEESEPDSDDNNEDEESEDTTEIDNDTDESSDEE